jgi:uncharacterized protein (TIGR01777 family)
MKIILAGGTGLIGQTLIKRLIEEDHQVWVLSRNPPEKTLSSTALVGVEWVRWDGKTTQGWGHLASEVDAIINLAGANIGERRWSAERKQVLRDSRVSSGKAIVAAIQENQHRPVVVIQIAGVGYYGPHGDEMLDEQSPAGMDFLAGVAKEWENSTNPVESLGVRRVVMRTGVVLSQKGGVLAPFLLQHRLFAGGPLGSGKQWISWIHMRDLMNSILYFLEREDARGVFNVTSPEPVTNAGFGKLLGKILRRPYWIPAPGFALRLALGEMSTLVLDGQRVLPRRLLEMGFQFQFPGLRGALEDLLN